MDQLKQSKALGVIPRALWLFRFEFSLQSILNQLNPISRDREDQGFGATSDLNASDQR